MLVEGEKLENQTGQMVMHVFRCLVSKFREMGRSPINYFRFVLGPTSASGLVLRTCSLCPSW